MRPFLGETGGLRLDLRRTGREVLLAPHRGPALSRPAGELRLLLGELPPLPRDRLPLLGKTPCLRLELRRARRQVMLALLRSSREPRLSLTERAFLLGKSLGVCRRFLLK